MGIGVTHIDQLRSLQNFALHACIREQDRTHDRKHSLEDVRLPMSPQGESNR